MLVKRSARGHDVGELPVAGSRASRVARVARGYSTCHVQWSCTKTKFQERTPPELLPAKFCTTSWNQIYCRNGIKRLLIARSKEYLHTRKASYAGLQEKSHVPYAGSCSPSRWRPSTPTAQTTSGVASLAQIYQQLGAAGLQDQVSFAAINVFGRTMATRHEGTSGRDHNGNHHATIMFGANIKGGVVGGITPVGGDDGASPIDAKTGQASASGDIRLEHSLASMGKTLSAALGLSDAVLDASRQLESGARGGTGFPGALDEEDTPTSTVRALDLNP